MGEEKKIFILCRMLYMIIESAEGLPDVREIFETKAYAEVQIGSGDDQIKSKTKPDRNHGLNPVWNHGMGFQIPAAGVNNYGLSVIINLYTLCTFGHRYIGEVHSTVKDLYDLALQNGGSAKLTLPVTNGTNQTGGTLKICYSFGEEYRFETRSSVDEFFKGVGRATQLLSLVALIEKIIDIVDAAT